jgi:hypothetical protein
MKNMYFAGKAEAPWSGATSRQEGCFLNLLDGLAYDIEPLGAEAGQGEILPKCPPSLFLEC